ncbi:M50 family metallopeptidase [Nocardioides sp. AX2bis]|uniref:M50 family metallopeptidase n=1 Tax=Nocardioides sp. AX2bis TaxID=2653157 RepID=UPI0012F46220|nr:M50 family metallopeptidase [Nocardioides sp. AX2bis]VXB94731.1 Putative membrane protein [Nocardioides sp. AX2bis]
MEVVGEIWGGVVGTQAPPTQAVRWLCALVALAVVGLPSTWRRTRVAVTVAHEGAHAAVAVLSGRRLNGVRLHRDSSGLTLSHGRPRGPGMVATAFAGYPGPALLGLGAAVLLADGRALAVLWLAVLLLAGLLLWVRNAYGLLAVGVSLTLVAAVSWWAEPRWQSAAAHVGTWFLLLGAVRAAVELGRDRRRERARTSDADVLARLTHVPAPVWVAVLVLVTLGAAALSARLLLTA